MQLEVDPRAATPPSEQLADQVRFAVAAGRLRVGDRLPSVRVLAAQARVNPNTVGRAWRELEREGLLEPRRGEGMFVAAGAPATALEARDRIVGERIARAVREASASGLAEAEILARVHAALARDEEGRRRA